MLVPEMDAVEREGVKQIAAAMASELGPGLTVQADQKAWPIVEHLRDMCGAEVTASRVASLVSDLLAHLAGLPVTQLADTLESSIAIYSLAAAHLAGVRDLPEREIDIRDLGFGLN